MIESKSHQQKRTVAAGFIVNPAAHLGGYKELGDLTGVLDKRIPHDGMDVIVLKRIGKRIGIGQKEQEGNEEAEKMVSSHEISGSLPFFEAGKPFL